MKPSIPNLELFCSCGASRAVTGTRVSEAVKELQAFRREHDDHGIISRAEFYAKRVGPRQMVATTGEVERC